MTHHFIIDPKSIPDTTFGLSLKIEGNFGIGDIPPWHRCPSDPKSLYRGSFMIKKVNKEGLKLGMFIHDLNCG